MVAVVFSLCSLLLCVLIVAGNECSNLCDNGIMVPRDKPIRLCGTDRVTHYTSYEAAIANFCYFNCNVGAIHQGPCECPNECFEDFGHGICGENKCICQEGVWGGNDCGSPGPKNDCNLHGKIVTPTDGSPIYCQCDEGFTGVDCSSAVLQASAAPWGNVLGKSSYASTDKYQDDHPVWNISELATIHVSLSSDEYIRLVTPEVIYGLKDFTEASVSFHNGHIRESFSKVGLKPKGVYSKLFPKKGWIVEFDTYVEGQNLFSVKRLLLKAGSGGSDSLLKNVFVSDMARAVGIPVQRMSFANLFINGYYEGIYIMQEDIDDDFIRSRFENDNGEGNLMKMCHNGHLQYYGENPDVYKSRHGNFPSGDYLPDIEQVSGNGNWTDYVELVRFLSETSDSQFLRSLRSNINVELFLKNIIIEHFMLFNDNFHSGQNYFMYHTVNSADTPSPWVMFEFNFDHSLISEPDATLTTNVASSSKDGSRYHGDDNFTASNSLFDYFIYKSKDKQNPLATRVLSIPELRRWYLDLYVQFVSTVFGVTAYGDAVNVRDPVSRYTAYLNFVEPWYMHDKFVQMSTGLNTSKFREAAILTMQKLPLRYKFVSSELSSAFKTP